MPVGKGNEILSKHGFDAHGASKASQSRRSKKEGITKLGDVHIWLVAWYGSKIWRKRNGGKGIPVEKAPR